MSKHKPKTSNLPAKYERGFLARMDARTELAQRLQSTFVNLIDDCGGPAGMTAGKMMLVERLCFLQEFLRQIEQDIASDPVGKPELLGRWTQGVNAMQGIIKTLKLDADRREAWIDALYSDPDPEDAPPRPPSTASKGGDGKGG